MKLPVLQLKVICVVTSSTAAPPSGHRQECNPMSLDPAGQSLTWKDSSLVSSKAIRLYNFEER